MRESKPKRYKSNDISHTNKEHTKRLRKGNKMKYVVISPTNKMICFNEADKVAFYCMQNEDFHLDKYCKEQQLEYESMTPIEIGYAYALVGAQASGCRIYETHELLKAMKEEGVENELIKEINEHLDAVYHEKEGEVLAYIEDAAVSVNPVPLGTLSGNLYRWVNYDDAHQDSDYPSY